MGVSWATCKFCGWRHEADFDPTSGANLAAPFVYTHVWLEHRDELPSFLGSLYEYVHWNACRECTCEAPCEKFERWYRGE